MMWVSNSVQLFEPYCADFHCLRLFRHIAYTNSNLLALVFNSNACVTPNGGLVPNIAENCFSALAGSFSEWK